MPSFTSEPLQNFRFLITGGAGFIGSHLVEYLLAAGAFVRVLDNLATGSSSNVDLFRQHPNYEFMEGDIRDLETCRNACQNIDYVSHQAALGSVPRSINEPEKTNAVNVSGFLHMLIAAKDAGVKRFVYASSSSVYGDHPVLPKVEHQIGKPLSPYAASKFANEMYAGVFHRIYGMEIIGLRYFNVFGPRQRPDGPYAAVIPLFIDAVMHHRPVFIDGDGLQTRDFTYVENAVQANIKSLFCHQPQAMGEIFNVAVGESFSVLHIYQEIIGITGKTFQAQHRPVRKGDVRDSLADISKAQRMLEYQPAVKFKEGLERTISHFKSHSQ